MSDDLYQHPVMQAYYATEYHRRNMQVARVVGAQAAVDQALKRALKIKSIPNWMIAYLESAANRLPGLSADLAAWRDLAHDAPTPSPHSAHVEALQAQLAEARAGLAQWQPIETAPKDGTAIDLWSAHDLRVADAAWDVTEHGRVDEPDVYGWTTSQGHGSVEYLGPFIHWMPRPAPPSPRSGAGNDQRQ
jgi:hypothetical protein